MRTLVVFVVGLVLGVRRSGGVFDGPLDRQSTPSSDGESKPTQDTLDRVGDGPAVEATNSPVTPADARIMTNEERVAHLLETHEGRMLQSEMVGAADLSKATVSRVLSGMEQAGAVTRVDIGRGNLVTRPEDEPPNVASPFED